MSLDAARAVADAVLYEGYLLYPYRATSAKNQSRWQFGVLGPPGAATAGLGEEPAMAAQMLLAAPGPGVPATVSVRVRFLQLQTRSLEQCVGDDQFEPVAELTVDGQLLYSWDEAVEHEVLLPSYAFAELAGGVSYDLSIGAGEEVEPVTCAAGPLVGRIVRRRWPLRADVRITTTTTDGFTRLAIEVDNTHSSAPQTKDDAIRTSLIGAHLLVQVNAGQFISLLEPPEDAAAAVAECVQHRCWPVLAGPNGSADVVLASPIILYDYPEIAPQSPGALFDGTEIDEILTLRVMTMTESEKAEAKATDPRAREIIERCETMSAADLQQLHGILRDPHADAKAAGPDAQVWPDEVSLFNRDEVSSVDPNDVSRSDTDVPWFDTGDAPWWDPAVDERVRPEVDAVVIGGVRVSKDSLVRVHPSRRADAQDLFFADQVARVTAVLSDVDAQVHVAVVLVDDPASDLHDWYGRYLYFAPDELEPLQDQRKESQS